MKYSVEAVLQSLVVAELETPQSQGHVLPVQQRLLLSILMIANLNGLVNLVQHTVNARNTEPVAAVQAATNGLGADVCIEAVGHPEVLRQAFYARDLAGTVVQVGVPTPDMVMPNIPMIDFFGRGGAMKPSWYGDCLPSRDFPLLVDLHLQGRLPLEDFVTETIGLSEIEQAFHRMERGEVLRSVVLL